MKQAPPPPTPHRSADGAATRDHGGDLDAAAARYGHGDWIDLSTGINRRPWPVGPLPDNVWRALPTAEASRSLIHVAADYFGCATDRVLPVPGASAAIQALPRLLGTGRAAVLNPTYNEHACSLRAEGWQVVATSDIADMAGADLAVVVNPNNPDGREWPPAALVEVAARTDHLIVDESFADPRPDLSLAASAPDNVVILRSFGKFWGLAGLRLGFVIAHPDLLCRLAAALGPWPVSGPALAVGSAALTDRAWADAAIVYHAEASLRLDHIAMRAGWVAQGGTHLFRLYATPDAATAQARLAEGKIWTRIFPYSRHWLRMGIPGCSAEWERLQRALQAV